MNFSVSHNSSNIVVHLRRPQDTIRIVRTDDDIVKRGEPKEAKEITQNGRQGPAIDGATSCLRSLGLKGK